MKTGNQPMNYAVIFDHFGDSILPYFVIRDEKSRERKEATPLPIIIRSKINYAEVRPARNGKLYADRHTVFPDSMLQGRQEIR